MTEFLVEENKGAIAIGVTISFFLKFFEQQKQKQQQINVLGKL